MFGTGELARLRGDAVDVARRRVSVAVDLPRTSLSTSITGSQGASIAGTLISGRGSVRSAKRRSRSCSARSSACCCCAALSMAVDRSLVGAAALCGQVAQFLDLLHRRDRRHGELQQTS